MDPRQIVAGVLTVTMFVMLANMIKRDHFHSPHDPHAHAKHTPGLFEDTKLTLPRVSSSSSNGPWDEDSSAALRQCWSIPPPIEESSQGGFVTFSLTNGPEYHVSQIADAVVVARYLRAALVLPDIRGSNPGVKRKFGDIYDVEKFVKSLDGVVRVVRSQPGELSAKNLAVVRIPNRVSEDYIAEAIETVFRAKGNVRLVTYFSSINMRKSEVESNTISITCLGMFGTLELQPEVQEVVDSMVERLRTLSRKSDGKFVAVDLRLDMLEKKGCQQSSDSGSKRCYSPQEIAIYLRKLGFDEDTTIYLTQSRWDSSLDALKDLFPKTYTKEGIIAMDKKSKFLDMDGEEYEKALDFYICSQSDVFVPAISGLFYANVAGQRIASGKTQILVPAIIPSPASTSVADYISPYISKQNHLAYSCFC